MTRPKIDLSKKRLPTSLAIRADIKGQIERLSRKYGMSTSRLVEIAIERLLESNDAFNNLLKPKQ